MRGLRRRTETQHMTPTAPGTRCTEPGCGTITTTGRCEKHARKPWANPSANTRTLTGRQRSTIRHKQLRREPQCRVCGTTKNLEADHIIPIADGGAWYAEENLQTLCDVHHAAKTAQERRQHAGA
jgi:5-methylcytosine-specific restriction endonuclease McrA